MLHTHAYRTSQARGSHALRRWASRGILSFLSPPQTVDVFEVPREPERGAAHPRDRIAAFVRIAATNGSTVSTDELRLLLPAGLFPTARSLEDYIRGDPQLSSSLVVLDGEVAPRGAEELFARRRAQRQLTEDRIDLAMGLVSKLSRRMPWLELVGISGSTAYGGAKPQDDIDFFLVTGKDRMWVTLLAAMALARVERSRSDGSPIFCFNRVTEHDACVRSFGESREPLFAREALNLRILRGHAYYRELLSNAPWMSEHFPGLYEAKLNGGGLDASEARPPGSALWSLANASAFVILGTYLWTVGLLRNARLARNGHPRAHFRTVIERDFCAYESRKYDELRDAYRRAV